MVENNSRFSLSFSENKEIIKLNMESFQTIGNKQEIYNRGYNAGKEDGLNERKYETWTMTLSDGSTVNKEIALL